MARDTARLLASVLDVVELALPIPIGIGVMAGLDSFFGENIATDTHTRHAPNAEGYNTRLHDSHSLQMDGRNSHTHRRNAHTIKKSSRACLEQMQGNEKYAESHHKTRATD